MKTKIVLWGTNDKDERVLIALQLRAKDNKVDLFTFPESLVTEDFYNQMMDNWRNDKECAFPEGLHQEERNLSATESLLPESLKVERGDLVQRAQTEWHFVVLSSKLNETYQSELSDLKEKIEGLTNYESVKWDDLKTFWSKVQNQIQERNLFREHANALRESTNGLFDHLKKLRSTLDEEFKTESKSVYDKFMTTLTGVDEKVGKGLNLQSIFNELRNIQRDFKDTKLTKEHRSKVWNRMDKLFKVVKEKRYGADAVTGNSPMDRFKKRYDGLMGAISRMDNSIRRDKSDLAFQGKRIEDSDGQLEAQIRQAKIKMIEERINSKNEKLEDMLKTKTELESKMAAQEERDKKNAERAKDKAAKEEAKKAAKEKIAAQIAEKKETHEADSEGLLKAAAAISAAKVVTTKKAPEVTKEEEPVAEKSAPTTEEVTEKQKEEPAKETDEADSKALLAATGAATTETKAVKVTEVTKEEEPVAEKLATTTEEATEKSKEEPAKEADSKTLLKAAAAITVAKVVMTEKAPEVTKEEEPVAEKLTTITEEATEKSKEEPAKEASSETLMSAIGVTLGEAFEDAVDTVKAIAEVVSDKVEDKIEGLKMAAADLDPKSETPKSSEEE